MCPSLQFAAIQGREVDVAVLTELATSQLEVDRLISNAVENAIFTVQEDAYRFAHDKMREGMLDTIDDANLPNLHAKIAEAIEKVYEEYIEDHALALAYHWREAGSNKAKEAQFAAIAGKQLVFRGSFKEAIPQMLHALDIYETVKIDDFELAKIHRILGEGYFSDGQMESARKHLKESTALLGVAFPKTNLGTFFGLLEATFAQMGHRFLPSKWFVRDGIEAEQAREASLAFERLSHIIFFDNATIALLYASIQSLNQAERAPASAELARAYGTICYSIGLVPQYPIAHFYERKALEVADIIQKQAQTVDPWVWEITAYFYASKGEMTTSNERYEKGMEVALEIGHVSRWLECRTLYGMNQYQIANFDLAAELREEIRQHAEKTQNEQAMGWAYLGISEYALLKGDFEEAQQALTISQNVTHRMGFTERAWMHGLFARMYSMQGDYAKMKQSTEDGIALLKDVPLANAYYTQEGYSGLAETCLVMADHPDLPESDKARLKWLTKVAIARLRGFANSFPMARAHARRVDGWSAWQQGKHEKAKQHWQKSLTEADKREKRFEKGLVYYDMGRFLPDGQQYLKQAHEIFDDLGFVYYREQVEVLMQ